MAKFAGPDPNILFGRVDLNIILNGSPFETEAVNLEQLCIALGYEGSKVATALNGAFIPRTSREDAKISLNDKIEILSPRQGG
ncbi:MAG: sulfur carrier protein ThiS [Methyloligellaceae bacterium]